MEHNQKFLTIFQKSEISEPALFSPSDTTKKLIISRRYVFPRFQRILFKNFLHWTVLKR